MRPIILLNVTDQLDYLRRAYELELSEAIEILTLCLITKIETINANGREWIYGEPNPRRFYLSGEELLLDSLNHLYPEQPRRFPTEAVLHAYAILPSEWMYAELLPDIHSLANVDVRHDGDVVLRVYP